MRMTFLASKNAKRHFSVGVRSNFSRKQPLVCSASAGTRAAFPCPGRTLRRCKPLRPQPSARETGTPKPEGSGTSAIANDDSYTGGTTIGAGCNLYVGYMGASASIQGSVVDNGVLAFAYASATTCNAAIGGSGSVVVAAWWGAGSVTLTGDNSYSGGRTINGGTL